MANLWVRTGNDGTDPDFAIDDLGFTIPTGASWTPMTEGSSSDPFVDGYGQFTARELRNSDDLYEAIIAGSLEYSTDGVIEATGTYVADLPITLEFADDDFNLSAGRLTLPNDVNPPTGIPVPRPGDLLYDTDDGYLVFYSGVLSQWITITDSGSVVTDHGTLTGLLDDDHTQYALLSGNAARNAITGKFDFGTVAGELGLPKAIDPTTAFPSATAGDLAYDTDDGYLVVFNGAIWESITSAAAATDHGALTGLGDDDHSQYGLLAGASSRNAVTGEYDFSGGELLLPSAVDPFTSYPGAVAGNIAYDTDDGYLVFYDGVNWVQVFDNTRLPFDHGTDLTGLGDDDHAQYGLLAGSAARNSVTGTYDFGDGYLIAPTHTAGPTPQGDGEIAFVNGVMYGYDSVRSKWLSVDRKMIWGGRDSTNATDVYLRIVDAVAMSTTSYRMLRDGTITGIVAETTDVDSWTLQVRQNGGTSPIVSLVMSTVTGNQSTTTNVNFSQGDTLELFASGTGISRPVGGIEIAWRV